MKVRISEGYQPDFDVDLRHGKRGEGMVATILQIDTVEVKSDRQAHRTGNIWLEYECRRKGVWTDSGIRTTKATHWALMLAESVTFIIPTPLLLAVTERGYSFADSRGRFLYRSEETDGSHPTHGIRIPLNHFLTWLRMELIAAENVGRPAVVPDAEPQEFSTHTHGFIEGADGVWTCAQDHYAVGVAPSTGCGMTWTPP